MPSAASPAIVTKNHAAGAAGDCQRQSSVVTVKSSKDLLGGNRAYRHRNIADIGAARGRDEKGIAPVLPRIGIARKAVAFGRQIFEARLLGGGQFGRNANRRYPDALDRKSPRLNSSH